MKTNTSPFTLSYHSKGRERLYIDYGYNPPHSKAEKQKVKTQNPHSQQKCKATRRTKSPPLSLLLIF